MKWLLDTNCFIYCNKKGILKYIKSDLMLHVTIFNLIEYPPLLKKENLTFCYPDSITYEKSIKYASSLREKGIAIGAIDILIGTIAIQKGLTLVTNDGDFKQLQQIEKSLQIRNLDEFIIEISDKHVNDKSN